MRAVSLEPRTAGDLFEVAFGITGERAAIARRGFVVEIRAELVAVFLEGGDLRARIEADLFLLTADLDDDRVVAGVIDVDVLRDLAPRAVPTHPVITLLSLNVGKHVVN